MLKLEQTILGVEGIVTEALVQNISSKLQFMNLGLCSAICIQGVSIRGDLCTGEGVSVTESYPFCHVNRQTPVKTLPFPQLHLQAAKISIFKNANVCC